MLEVIKNLVPPARYKLKCPNPMQPKYIVVHNTANDASAKNEIAYMIRNEKPTGFHFAIDDREIVQGIPEDRNAWHAGDGAGKGNMTGIGIEICYSKSGGARFDAAERLAVKFIVQKLKEYNWSIDRVIRHFDCSGKNCPHRTMEKGWDRFLDMIRAEMEGEDQEVVKEIKMKINGRLVKVQTIEKDGNNFVKLQDLRLNGLDVKYDNKEKIAEINFAR
ncbi:MAG: N-acetylmuramoyl-L-alanine amidase [Peptostreptococcaceae bacterium]|nr:N-acetylmuramoyl-L-alanine amidase [Peptostreptococcaceae bacterium]